MNTFKAGLILLVFIVASGLGYERLAAIDAKDFSTIPVDNADTMEKYVDWVRSAGGTVIIDCYESDKMLEKPLINNTANGKCIETSFYQVSFSDKLCRVSPIDAKWRSRFLSIRIPSFAIDGLSLKDAIARLNKESGARIAALEMDNWAKGKENVRITLNLQNETVEQILLAVASAYGSNRIVLLPGINANGERTEGAFIEF